MHEEPELKKSLGTRVRRGDVNTEIDLKVIGWEGVDGINLAQDRDQFQSRMNTLMNI
jgi:hypothetical protein